MSLRPLRRLALLALALASSVAYASEASALPEPVTSRGTPPASAPANVDGLWCGTGLLHEFSLRLSQQYQELQGTLSRKQRVRQIQARVEGRTLYTQATKVGSLVLELTGDELRVIGGEGKIALIRGMSFKRTAADRCAG